MPFFPDMSRWFENGTEQPKNASSDRGVFFKKIDKTRSPSWLYVMNNLIIHDQIKQMLKHAQYRCKICIQVRSAWLDQKRVVCSVPYKTCSCYKSYFWWVSCLEKKNRSPPPAFFDKYVHTKKYLIHTSTSFVRTTTPLSGSR